MNRIGVVFVQAATVAGKGDLGRFDQGLGQAQEQEVIPTSMMAMGQKLAPRPRQGHVAEPRRGQGGHREIQGVDIARDTRMAQEGRIDEAGPPQRRR